MDYNWSLSQESNITLPKKKKELKQIDCMCRAMEKFKIIS